MKGISKQISMCGRVIRLGDYIEVEYTTGDRMKGGILRGNVTELWSPETGAKHLQARINNGWCFHNHDRILVHNKEE